MPEYLAPGVFVEEVSFRSKSIEGVPTSTTGMAGLAHFGPVQYTGGPRATEPRLVTSYVEFERVYGSLGSLDAGVGGRLPFLAHAARAFFLNGGRRLYVSRVFAKGADDGVAHHEIAVPTPAPGVARLVARWPGAMGNVAVTVTAVRSGDVGDHSPANTAAKANLVQSGALLQVVAPAPAALPRPEDPIDFAALRVLRKAPDGTQTFHDGTGQAVAVAVTDRLLPVEVTVTVEDDNGRRDSYVRLGLDPGHRRAITKVLSLDDPDDEDAVVSVQYEFPPNDSVDAIFLLRALVGDTAEVRPRRTFRLEHGNDGVLPGADAFKGMPADPDHAEKKATALEALAEVDDIAIVALPDAGSLGEDDRNVATQYLIRHAEACRYRIAVVDGPQAASMNEIRAFRGNYDSTYAALYHPWIEVLDPSVPSLAGVPAAKLLLPPSGFVAGIYARTDISRGVFKAPANEVVYGLTKFEININQGRNEVLNPEHINALRFFPGRGSRVWGARTLSSDPEWLYVNVRRLFIFLEHSIDKATQWAVFEPNGYSLWRNITQTVEDFLQVQWRNGALLGKTPEEAYFVRCDRTTMTQNDLDNGRLICLIGVAPVKPAEFVIFRIGQWTADSRG
jgi:phage tail sheath protein FI